jgi:hypothetical protein
MAPTEGSVKVLGRSARSAKARVGYLAGKMDLERPSGLLDGLLGRKKKSPPPARGVARVAQAMLGNRDVLVLDDPFADLNAAELAEAKTLIRDMVARGKTVLLSSDSLTDVKDVSDRLVILHEGKVQASGALDELLSSATAIRFFPAVLPAESTTRLLQVLREEIQKIPGRTSPPEPKKKSPASSETPPASDTIDHGKLEGLSKPSNPR